ncbi:MAG: hypothetical protein NVS3B7_10070 [Candidatus Elarobacter sp.]
MQTGDLAEAARCVTAALALNPHFDPFGADDARRRLARLGAAATSSPQSDG